MDHLYLGAAYYPELWDSFEQEMDIARIKQLGLNTVRIGEFAWGTMESKEGEFNFDWLKNVVDKLYENGIYTVMCTPSATPPRWLLDKYPETRMVTADMVRVDVSSRCHTCKTSPIMRKKNAEIVTRMAEVFSRHRGIIGWQIDNEIFPYNEGCFCDNCKAAFRAYLKEKYGTIENINQKWGMTRWSLCYETFDDIRPPYPRQWRHPSLRKAWRDFQYRQIKTYVDDQADILHKYGCKNVGTDMMTHNSMSYNKINEKLDVVQYNHYEPAGALADTAFGYDFLRCVKDKPFWVTETQVGWNGSEFAENGYRPKGNCYINTMLPLSKGAQMNLYWLFRTHPHGHELAHGALYSPSGRMYREAEEVRQAADSVAKCEGFLTGTKICSRIALSYSSTAFNQFESAPILKDFNYRNTLIKRYYSAFRHYNVDIIDTQHALDGYKVVVSPFLATADENGFKERITEWIKAGGTWIVGPMSDIMDGDVVRYTTAPHSFVEELAGVYVRYQKPLDNDVFKAQWTDGDSCAVSMCYDAYDCNDGTESLARYTVGEFAPLSVITERRVGKGKVILVGSVISQRDLLRLVNMAPIAVASENVILTARSGAQDGIIAVETEHRSGYIDLDGQYIDLITGNACSGKTELSPYQVLVLSR